MRISFRVLLKGLFDSIVYRYPFINRILRNVNKLLSPFISFKLRPYGILKVKLENGISFRMATNETNAVTKMLFWNGADNYEYTSIFKILISKCVTFLDIGSNTGYYALLAAKINPAIKVFAFEPASAPLQFLIKNVSLNNLQLSINVFDLALSDKKGEMEFYEVDNYEKQKYNLAGSGTLQPINAPVGKFRTRIIKTNTLDEFINTNAITKVDLIKLDTEGTEHLILRSAHRTLSHFRPIIICETLFQVIESELDNIMRNYNYRFFNFKNGKLFKTESIIRDFDNGVRDCFFVPSEKENWVNEFLEN